MPVALNSVPVRGTGHFRGEPQKPPGLNTSKQGKEQLKGTRASLKGAKKTPHQWKEPESRNSIQDRKASAESLWPGVFTALPPCPGDGWSLIVWLQQQRAELQELPVIPNRQQGWRKALLIPFTPESSSLQQALSKHRELQPAGTSTLLHFKLEEHRAGASLDL